MEYEDRYVQGPKYDCLLFDLDDTLYPLSSGLAKEVLKNIHDFMVEKLGIERNMVDPLSDLLYKYYGTTMSGLKAIGYDFDYDEYHSFVHGRLPYDKVKPDPVLRSLLLSMPMTRKVIFTNADEAHATKVLGKLGLDDCFERIICFETLNPTHKIILSHDKYDYEFVDSTSTNKNRTRIFNMINHFATQKDLTTLPSTPIICKPSEYAIERSLQIANLSPQRTIFFDDSVRNIQAGKRVGLDTVLVGTSQKPKGVDYTLENIHNLKEALPELWEAEVKKEVGYHGKIARETPVTA